MCASPYAWQSGFVGERHRIGGADPAGEVARRLVALGLKIEEETDVAWTLRRDARAAAAFSVHYLRLSRPPLLA